MIWQILLVLIMTWFIISHCNNRELMKLASQVPKYNSRSFPFVGQAYIMVGSDADRMKGLQKVSREANANDGLIYFWLGRRFMLVLTDAEICERILKTCLQKDDLMNFISDITGNGLVFAEKSIWRPRRKVMMPAFSPKHLNQFTEIFTRQSKIMAHNLEKNCDKEDFSIFRFLTSYAMDAVFESNVGINLGVQNNPNHQFLEAFDKACQVIAARICQPWLQFNFIYRLTPTYRIMEKTIKTEMYGFIEKIIKQKRMKLEEKAHDKATNNTPMSYNNDERLTFMEMLLENSGGNDGYTDLELREELLVLVLAGTDTSAVGASFTLLMLAKHDDVQAKLLTELREVFGDHDRPLTNEDFPKLKYLDAVVKESLRLYPPAPFIARKVDKDMTLPTGLKLCPGIGLLISIWGIHRNPKYWGEDAELFRPERFLDEKLSHPAAFMPFSYGPRNCIGYNYALMSIKVVVSTVLRKYKVLPALSNTNFAPHFVNGKKAKEMAELKFDIMMKDCSNFMLRLQSR